MELSISTNLPPEFELVSIQRVQWQKPWLGQPVWSVCIRRIAPDPSVRHDHYGLGTHPDLSTALDLSYTNLQQRESDNEHDRYLAMRRDEEVEKILGKKVAERTNPNRPSAESFF